MAKRKVSHADRAIGASKLTGEPQWQLAQMLCALRHWADASGASYAAAEATASRHYFADLASASGQRSSGYDGWERIHDDNKAEGRPIGDQWSKEGVLYDHGHKVYARYPPNGGDAQRLHAKHG